MSKFKCPTCDGYIPNNEKPGAYAGAISRTDNKTEICSACGVAEALLQLAGTPVYKTTKCECGNNIDERDLGEGATQCEWCENPEVPMYKINDYGDRVELFCLGTVGAGYVLHIDSIYVIAPNESAAKQIYWDYQDTLRKAHYA